MRSAVAPKLNDGCADGSRLQGAFGLEGRVSLSVVTMPAATWEPSPREEDARGEAMSPALETYSQSTYSCLAATPPLAWLLITAVGATTRSHVAC